MFPFIFMSTIKQTMLDGALLEQWSKDTNHDIKIIFWSLMT